SPPFGEAVFRPGFPTPQQENTISVNKSYKALKYYNNYREHFRRLPCPAADSASSRPESPPPAPGITRHDPRAPRIPERTRAQPKPRPCICRFEACSALRELERAAGLAAAILLALDHARVAGQEAGGLQRGAQPRLVQLQRLGDAVLHRTGLARQPAAGNGGI